MMGLFICLAALLVLFCFILLVGIWVGIGMGLGLGLSHWELELVWLGWVRWRGRSSSWNCSFFSWFLAHLEG